MDKHLLDRISEIADALENEAWETAMKQSPSATAFLVQKAAELRLVTQERKPPSKGEAGERVVDLEVHRNSIENLKDR